MPGTDRSVDRVLAKNVLEYVPHLGVHGNGPSTGHSRMFALNHLMVHLRDCSLRERGGLRVGSCVVSDEAEFLGEIPPEYAHLYSLVKPSASHASQAALVSGEHPRIIDRVKINI